MDDILQTFVLFVMQPIFMEPTQYLMTTLILTCGYDIGFKTD